MCADQVSAQLVNQAGQDEPEVVVKNLQRVAWVKRRIYWGKPSPCDRIGHTDVFCIIVRHRADKQPGFDLQVNKRKEDRKRNQAYPDDANSANWIVFRNTVTLVQPVHPGYLQDNQSGAGC